MILFERMIEILADDSLNFKAPFQTTGNLDDSNTDSPFNLDDSNSVLSPSAILPMAQENKYLGKSSYFILKLYVVCTH